MIKNSPSENLFKVQESFSAPKTPKFSVWYQGIQRVLEEVQEQNKSIGEALDQLKDVYGLRLDTADMLTKEAFKYGQEIRDKLKNLQRY